MSKTTPAKAAANRANALLSTGPRTPEGKAASSKNAVRHGLLARETLMEHEDVDAFEELQRGLVARLAPEGELEAVLVDRVVANLWRLKRLATVESGFYLRGIAQTQKYWPFEKKDGEPVEASEADMLGHVFNICGTADRFLTLSRYETALERSVYKALHELQRLQAARRGEKPPLPVAIDADFTPGEG